MARIKHSPDENHRSSAGEHEIHALAVRGWTVAAIARHTGRDPKTVRKYIAEPRPAHGPVPSCLEPFRAYLAGRFADDAHVFATKLYDELVGLGFDRSYPTFVRELRGLGLRPACQCCHPRAGRVTYGCAVEPGDELRFDWLELPKTPWGAKARILLAVLPHSGRLRGCFSEGESFAHLIEALDGALRRLGGTPRLWRTDRLASVVYPDRDQLRPEAVAAAKHYGVTITVGPSSRPWSDRVLAAGTRYVAQSWWSSAPVSTQAQAQADLDRWCVAVADRRRRGRSTVAELAVVEPLLSLPELPFPAEHREEHVVPPDALVSFDGNRYSVPAGHAGQPVEVRARLGELHIEVYSVAGRRIVRHRRAVSAAGQTIRMAEHARPVQQVMLDVLTPRDIGSADLAPTPRYPAPALKLFASARQAGRGELLTTPRRRAVTESSALAAAPQLSPRSHRELR